MRESDMECEVVICCEEEDDAEELGLVVCVAIDKE